uniref:t-SNARE coiled-coil homology domain-containing protein n=1 Tax=Peronospora matthiolae TaxID=2874970 RepID=A0AAV1UXL1_9STRA
MFGMYFEDYEQAQQEALKSIGEYTHAAESAKRKQLAVLAKHSIDEVERYIRILENEAKNGSSITKKRRMMEQVRQCRTKWSALKTSFEKELLAETTRARELSQSSMDGTSTTEQLESCAAHIDRTGRHLDEAQRTLVHTEAIAENVANNLLQQHDQLERTEVNITQTQDDTKEAKSHLRSMAFRACTSRVLLLLVMLGLVVAIILVSYYRWYPSNQKDYLGILPNSTDSGSGSGIVAQ